MNNSVVIDSTTFYHVILQYESRNKYFELLCVVKCAIIELFLSMREIIEGIVTEIFFFSLNNDDMTSLNYLRAAYSTLPWEAFYAVCFAYKKRP